MRTNLIVDGELSGTGIRDADAGGYIKTNELALSPVLLGEISDWLLKYANAHYCNFADQSENERLDYEGIEIAKRLREECPNCRIQYYSNALLRRIPIT